LAIDKNQTNLSRISTDSYFKRIMRQSIIKKTKNLGDIEIKTIDKKLSKKLIIENHYSHKWLDSGFGKYNYGIFRKGDDECLGVAAYGLTKHPKARLFDHPNSNAVMLELNRMWISDELGHNAESLLISSSLRLLQRTNRNIVAVQSFADGRLGCGTIYKASNFRYFGYHYTHFARNKRTGEIIHEQVLSNKCNTSGYLRSNIAFLIGDMELFRVKTYRYIYPFCKHFVFTKAKQRPYPEYEKGVHEPTWNRDHTLVAGHITKLVYKLII